MLTPILFYLVLPFFLSWLVLRFIKRYGKNSIALEIAQLYNDRPIEKGFFRVLQSDAQGHKWLGDFETEMEAVDRAYQGKEAARREGVKAAFLVLNEKGETLQETDA